MTNTKNVFIGLLVIIIATTSIIIMNTGSNLKQEFTKNESRFYICENVSDNSTCQLASIEYWQLYDGKKLLKPSSTILKYSNDTERNIIFFNRLSKYNNGVLVVHNYTFEINNSEITEFPIKEEVYVLNVSSNNYSLRYMVFVNNSDRMNIIYYSPKNLTIINYTNTSYKIILSYNITSGNNNFTFRVYDPIISNFSGVDPASTNNYMFTATVNRYATFMFNVSQNSSITNILVRLAKIGAPGGTLYGSIYNMTNNTPTVLICNSSLGPAISTINTQPTYSWVNLSFTNCNLTINQGQIYGLRMETNDHVYSDSNYVYFSNIAYTGLNTSKSDASGVSYSVFATDVAMNMVVQGDNFTNAPLGPSNQTFINFITPTPTNGTVNVYTQTTINVTINVTNMTFIYNVINLYNSTYAIIGTCYLYNVSISSCIFNSLTQGIYYFNATSYTPNSTQYNAIRIANQSNALFKNNFSQKVVAPLIQNFTYNTTVCAWLSLTGRNSDSSTLETIISNGDYSTQPDVALYITEATGVINILSRNDTVTVTGASSVANNISLNNLTFICGNWNITSMKLYKNAALINVTARANGSINARSNFTIGGVANGSGSFLNGSIYHVYDFNCSLNDTQISLLYNLGPNPIGIINATSCFAVEYLLNNTVLNNDTYIYDVGWISRGQTIPNITETRTLNITSCLINLTLNTGLNTSRWTTPNRFTEFNNISGSGAYYTYILNGSNTRLYNDMDGSYVMNILNNINCTSIQISLSTNLTNPLTNQVRINVSSMNGSIIINDSTIKNITISPTTNRINISLTVDNLIYRYVQNTTTLNNTYLNTTNITVNLMVT